MMIRSLSLLLCLCCSAVSAAPSLQLPMKLDYAEGVIINSNSAKRIEASGNEEAIAKLQQARDKYQQARKAQQDGDFERSEQLANEAIRLVTAASIKVPAKEDSNAAKQRRYKELLSQVDTYRNWQHNDASFDADNQLQMDKAIEEIEKAGKLAAANDYDKANEFLSMALEIIIRVKNSSLKQRTFSYDLNFETPIDEYQYELSRNDDYLRLIPIAITQKQPSAGVQSLMQRYVEKAKVKRHDAEAQFTQKQYEMAVASLQDSSKDLISALKIAGVR